MMKTSLTIQQRLLVHLAKRGGVDESLVVNSIVRGKARREGRWLKLDLAYDSREQSLYYLPFGDDRDAQEFRVESNQERRRLIYRACGDRVVPGPTRKLLQQDDYGILYEITTVDPTTWQGHRVERQVRVVCPSTGDVYWLPVSNRCRSAHEAVAETFGLDAEQYQPAVEA